MPDCFLISLLTTLRLPPTSSTTLSTLLYILSKRKSFVVKTLLLFPCCPRNVKSWSRFRLSIHPSLQRSHDHRLFWETEPIKFDCSGCKEKGCGASFRCDPCEYYLHDVCAKHQESIPHPFIKGRKLEFIWDTFGHFNCIACGRTVDGCGYHQRKERGYSLHPLCAKLPGEITYDQGQKLYLRDKLKSKCCLCESWKQEGGVGALNGWSYRSTCNKHHVHVSCAKYIGVKMCEGMERAGENSSSKEISLAPYLKMISERSGTSSKGWKIRLFCKVGLVLLKLSLNILIGIFVGVPINGAITWIESLIPSP